MNGEFVNELVHLLIRWAHVVAGVIWIGHLYFFNWVNAHFVKTLDAESKKKVVPELMPRALYFFRWGAVWTWISGMILLGYVYYMGQFMAEDPAKKGMAIMRASILVIVIPVIYDVLWRRVFKAREQLGVAVSTLLMAVTTWYLASFLPPRAAFIHLGAAFGTAMAMNVWMRIWPAQRKIIAAIKAGKAPDADLVATAGLRSKHNTYMSVPLLFTMVSNHSPLFFGFAPDGNQLGWVLLVVLVLVAWGCTKLIYNKSGKVTGF